METANFKFTNVDGKGKVWQRLAIETFTKQREEEQREDYTILTGEIYGNACLYVWVNITYGESDDWIQELNDGTFYTTSGGDEYFTTFDKCVKSLQDDF